jgi:hypothetical protein
MPAIETQILPISRQIPNAATAWRNPKRQAQKSLSTSPFVASEAQVGQHPNFIFPAFPSRFFGAWPLALWDFRPAAVLPLRPTALSIAHP